MSETNGHNLNPKPEWLERLERVEASHVKVMTDFEVFAQRHEQWAIDYERRWQAQERRWEAQERQWQEQRKRGDRIDARIDKLVSGIGALAGIKLNEGRRKKRSEV